MVATANDAAGISELIGWLRTREVGRVGLEASGGYERNIRAALEEAGFEVVLHQPLEVKRFGQFKRQRIKNDKRDAQLIAAATAQVAAVRAAQDSRLRDLAQRLTAYEHVTDQIVMMKTFLEGVDLKDIARAINGQIKALTRLKARLAADILARIKAEPDLKARYDLLLSLPGVGPIVAISLVVRMPELGAMKRGQPASLLGSAPFDRDSGQWNGKRFISGGRGRPRRMMYLAALQARRCSPTFKAFSDRLLARGKPAKVIIVAVMRKLIEAANLVLQRGQPWTKTQAA